MKKLLLILSLLLPTLLHAQQSQGLWQLLPTYGASTKLIDTPDQIYNLTGTSLTGLDKTTGEAVAYNRSHHLNGNKVKNIWYNAQGKYLFVLHTDFNVDILYDDGRTVNIADMAHTTIDMPVINDVAFYGDKAYLATAKGLIVIDADNGLITESSLNGTNMLRIAATDKSLIVKPNYNNYLYIADRAGTHPDFAGQFAKTSLQIYSDGSLLAFGNNKMLGVGDGSSRKLQLFTIDDTKPLAQRLTGQVVTTDDGTERYALQMSLAPTKGGGATAMWAGTAFYNIYFDADGNILSCNDLNLPDWKATDKTSLPLANFNSSAPTQLWAANTAGVARYDASSNTLLAEPVKPFSSTCPNVGHILPFSDGRLLLATIGIGNSTTSISSGATVKVDILENNKTKNISAFNSSSIYKVAINPVNPDDVIVAARGGIVRYDIKENKRLSVYDETNSSLVKYSGVYMVSDIGFDKEGNIYFTQHNPDQPGLHIVKKDKWNGNPAKEDWTFIPVENFTTRHSTRMVVAPNGNALITGSAMDCAVNPSTKAYSVNKWGNDADGMTISGVTAEGLLLDSSGNLWIGNSMGVIIYDDFTNPNRTPRRPKVARNDGTNLADFLLDKIEVLQIAEDANRNKWFATYGSGLYRVSEDGTKILQHFSTDNSDIPSDIILAVYPDPTSNKVYVGTDIGLAILHSTSSPASDSMKEMYAYPNPVTPNYTGYITIAGLMDNSLVKIADAQGNVFCQGVSDGGSFIWDGCDATGSRVKSGVYFVLASQQDGSGAGTTKIVVVN